MAGETTVDLVPSSPSFVSKSVGQVVAQPFTVALRTTDLALNDITGVGKVPANSTTLGFHFFTDDLDSGSEALVWSIYIGTTAVATGITNAVAKAGATYFPCITGPVTVTAETIVYLKATTAAATAVAGNCVLTPMYITSA
jgi:hypothetical protein